MSAVKSVNRQWLLKARPATALGPEHLEYREQPYSLPALAPGEVVVRNTHFGHMPAQRTWMNADSSYFPPMKLDRPVVGPAIGEVVASANERYPVGAVLQVFTGWEDYSHLKGKFMASPIPAGVDPVESYSLYGTNTLTAYFGLLTVGEPKPGETVVVSGAAGSTGSMVAQIARIKGCKVVGIAGGAAKCKWLMDVCKIDGAIDYKAGNVPARLKELAPAGVNVFFDNVGGDILADVYDQMAPHGRIVMCGQIAEYNSGRPAPGPRDMFRVVSHRLKIQGFIVSDFMGGRPAAMADLTQWIKDGKLVHRADVRTGFKDLPAHHAALFTGGNAGTLVSRNDF